MKDFMSKHEEEVRVSSLKTETGFSIDEIMGIDEHQEDLEEAHYFHTINAFVELVIMYGSAKVLDDLDKALLGAKE